ncbi:MAG: Rrf2 family transcriptional regulator [Cyanobium sp. MAG_137]|jgi:Rrf2 family transcriptional regulator, iron-sulfur cluster assembly transcription factor|nr:Rrf2 family transcriptional regulator [Cyanobium sp. MAG_255]MDP4831875.1 Rrf2 family transcriptional regulator [Cyanobium sp. MAG_185]MDP4880750.1 Rrf2 family transcriptional regulator [Cyanobium sp. MAG_137]MDP4947192.1 Rrf2 family transcriptional regulator [Cyanobium sp. MAG_102]
MLSRQASHALKALLGLAARPLEWQSTHALATAHQLPEPMLEQLLLRLRRAGLLDGKRGRLGGYRLTRPARDISMEQILAGLGETLKESANRSATSEPASSPADQVTHALQLRLERVRLKALAELSLEDLLFDLRSAVAGSDSEGGLMLG